MNTGTKEHAHLDATEVQAKFEANKALSLLELSLATGMSYTALKKLRPRLPMIGNVIFPSDFELWRRQKTGLQTEPAAPAHPRRSRAGKSDALSPTHG